MNETRLLFDIFERTDPTPALHAEDSFSFLNRARAPYWDAIRDVFDQWFVDYSADAAPTKANDLRARYRSTDPRQHHPAWWELYLHQLLRRLHASAEIQIEEDRGDGLSRADYCVVQDTEKLYVEAVKSFAWVTEDSHRHPAREAFVLDAINELSSRDFAVAVDFDAVGGNHPRKIDIQRPLEAWLASLDADAELATYEAHGLFALPITHVKPTHDWDIVVQARPLDPSQRGRRRRLIEIGPGGGGIVIDEAAVREALLEKAGRYDTSGYPFVIALMPESISFGDHKAANILYGNEERQFDPDHPEGGEIARSGQGVFTDRSHDGVSGVLIGAGIHPWTVATTWPRLWENPFADRPLYEWAFPTTPRLTVDGSGALLVVGPGQAPAFAFGLPDSWPPGDPFPDDVE